MKNLLTRISVLVACLSFVLPASAYSLWLVGDAGAMGSDNVAGWDPASCVEVKSDANGDAYFWASGNFKLSKVASRPNNWDGFNADLVQLNSSGNITWGGGSDSNVGEGKKYVKFHMESGKDYCTIQDTPFTSGGGNNPGESEIYIYGDFTGASSAYTSNSWGNTKWKKMSLATNSNTVYEFKFNANKKGNVFFRINDNNTQYGPTDTSKNQVLNTDDQYVNAGVNGGTAFQFEAQEGHPYYIKYTSDHHSVAIYDAFQENPTTTDYWLAGGFLDNWGKRVKFEPTEGNDKIRTVTVTYGEGNRQNKGFKITTKESTDEGIWYSLGGERINKDTEVDVNKTASENMKLQTGAINKEVVLTLTLDEKGYPKTLKAEWEGENIGDIPADYMPVYPIGVYSEDALMRYSEWPVMYLLGGTLNNNRVTPEYQMNKIAADHYELVFTARNTETGNSATDYFGAGDQKISVKSFKDCYSEAEDVVTEVSKNFGKDQWKEGVSYKAILKKQGGSWNLTFELVDPEKHMPFLSMAGANWKQRAKATTPDGKSTDDGWQEAWIQYDNRGQVCLDRDGNVMYNTYWPPRNPILFKTEIDLNGKKDFTLSSKDLTFVAGETKTGEEWMDEYSAKGKSTNRINNNKVPDNGKEFTGQLALDPGRRYTRYRVADMWINGKVKIWSGWSGYRNGNDAIWSWHANWGHYSQNPMGTYTSITSESTVPLFNINGDMEFSKPTFFKYVDFFYDCEAPQGKARSMLYTELAPGGAQIAALSSNDYTVGNYQAALNNISNVLEANVTKVVIDSYSTVSNGTQQTEEMVSNVLTWTGNVNVKDFYTIFSDMTGTTGVTEEGKTDNATYSISKWVEDPTKYDNGDYFYRMTVTLAGQSEPIVVNSNPFTIFNPDENITLNVYQLVKIEDIPADKSQSGQPEGHYVTFRGKSLDEPDTPVFPVYELWIENDTKFDPDDDINKFKDDETGEMLGYIDDKDFKYRYKSLSTMPDYKTYEDKTFGHTYFTDKVFIVGSVPSANQVDGYQFGASDYSADAPANGMSKSGPLKVTDNEEWDLSRMQPEYGDRFMYVTNVGTFNQRQFDLKMKYTTSFIDINTGELVEKNGDVTAAEPVMYQTVIPEPILKETEVNVYYGKTIDNDDDNNSVGNFKYNGLDLLKARYTNVCDYITVEYPNVSTFMKERIIDENVFTLKLDLPNDEENDITTWDNIYNFGLVSSDGDANNNAALASNPMKPAIFTSQRSMRLIKDETKGYAYYGRGWEDQLLPTIEVSANRPVMMANNIQEQTYDTENGLSGKAHTYRVDDPNDDYNMHLFSEFTVNVMHAKTYKPTPASIDPTEEEKGYHNYVFHPTKDGNTHSHLLRHNNVVYLENVNKDFEDYYYVAVIDYDGTLKNDVISDIDAENALELDKYIIDNMGRKEGDVGFDSTKKLHFVVPASQMLNGNSYPITIKKDYGKFEITNKEQSDAFDKKVAEINADHFSKNIKVLVSYLYPFKENEEAPKNSAKRSPNRAGKQYDGDVLKSMADIYSENLSNGSIITSVNNLNSDQIGNLNVGKGYISVEGNGVLIINAAGVTIGNGSGRYDVEPGVYVVRYNGKSHKVVVR